VQSYSALASKWHTLHMDIRCLFSLSCSVFRLINWVHAIRGGSGGSGGGSSGGGGANAGAPKSVLEMSPHDAESSAIKACLPRPWQQQVGCGVIMAAAGGLWCDHNSGRWVVMACTRPRIVRTHHTYTATLSPFRRIYTNTHPCTPTHPCTNTNPCTNAHVLFSYCRWSSSFPPSS
jgi:hypothetical protein